MPENKQSFQISDSISINLTFLHLEKFLKYFIFGGIIFIVLLPILGDYGKTLFPLGRDVIFRISVEIIFFFFILLAILNRSCLPKLSPIFIFLILFWIISGIATIFSSQPLFSFWGNIFRGQGFFSQTHYLLFFIIAAGIIRTWREWKIILWSVILASFPITIIGLNELAFGGIRLQSTLNNPVFYGAYLLLVIFMTSAVLIAEKRKLARFALIAALFLQIINFYFANSLGSYFGMILGAGVFVLCLAIYKFGVSKKIVAVFTLISMIAIIGAFLLISPTEVWVRRSAIAMEGRLEPWLAGISAMKEKPLFGFGPENFIVASDKFFSGTVDESGYAWWDKAHSSIFETGATTGILGLLGYIGIFAAAFWTLIRKRDANMRMHADNTNILRSGLIATFTAYLSQNFFNIDTVSSLIYVNLWLVLANFLSERDANMLTHTNNTNKSRGGKTIFILSLIILLPLLIFIVKNYNARALAANHKFGEAEEYISRENFQMAFQKYEEGLKINDLAVNPHLRFRYAQTAMGLATFKYYTGQDQDEENIKKAIILQEENAKKEWPKFTRNWLFSGILSKFLIIAGHDEYKATADDYFKKALNLSPKRGETMIEWAKMDIETRDYAQAEKKVETVIARNKKNGEARWVFGLVKLLTDQTGEAEQYFQKARNLGHDNQSFEALNEIAMAYNRIGDFKNLIKTYEIMIKKWPQVFEYQLKLAQAHKDNRDIAKARELAENALKFVPSYYQPKIKDFLNGL